MVAGMTIYRTSLYLARCVMYTTAFIQLLGAEVPCTCNLFNACLLPVIRYTCCLRSVLNISLANIENYW